MPRAKPFNAADIAARNSAGDVRPIPIELLSALSTRAGVRQEDVAGFAKDRLALRSMYLSVRVMDEQEAPGPVAAGFNEIANSLDAFASAVDKSPQFRALKRALYAAAPSVRQQTFFHPARLDRMAVFEAAVDKLDEIVGGKVGNGNGSAAREITPSRAAMIDEATILQLPERVRDVAEMARTAASARKAKIKAHRPSLPGQRARWLAHALQWLAIHYGNWNAAEPEAREAWLREALTFCRVRAPRDQRKFKSLLLPDDAGD
jgi:hypothetical protein